MSKTRSRWAAMGVATAMGAVMLAGVSLFGANEPSLYLEGLQLEVKQDGSIQAFVDLYASDVEKLTTGAVLLKYNPDYWEPSSYTDNTLCTGESSAFFQSNPELYKGTNTTEPFLFEDSQLHTKVDETGAELLLGFNLKEMPTKPLQDYPQSEQGNYLDPDAATDDAVEAKKWTGDHGERALLYIKAEKKLKLGTLSFRVDATNLPKMTADLAKLSATTIAKADLDTPANTVLYPLSKPTTDNIKNNMTGWEISHIDDSTDDIKGEVYDDGDTRLHIDLKMPDEVVSAEAAADDITINAYEAFTTGEISDLAAALQRYSSTVRLTYPNGDQRDEAMYWGGNLMTIVDESDGTTYEFQYTQNGYTCNRISGTGTYDPTHGVYTITQKYVYEETDTTKNPPETVKKEFPVPLKVKLTVTPVKVTGIVAEDLYKSYKIDDKELPDESSKLTLPKEGKLTFDTLLGGTTPVMPLATWTNGQVTLPVTSAQMDTITGVDSLNQSVKWPTTQQEKDNGDGVGSYTFQCADPTQAAIQKAYPWATVDNSYTVTATRVIKDATAEDVTYTVKLSADDQAALDENALQVLVVERTDGKQMLANTSFEVYRPDGTLIDPSWFTQNPTSPLQSGGTHYWVADGTGYKIYTYPGKTPTGERELTRRHINLGGYFTVVVKEGNYGPSEPIKVYQPPRQNIYLYNYITPADGVAADPNNDRFEFDFTGKWAGLYAFHIDSTLPAHVVLPLNTYIVETRYDAVTGEEPGETRQFVVDSWKATDASGNTQPNWAANNVVTFGEDLFANPSYLTGFGVVENPKNRTVKMKVQTDNVTTPPDESLLLTYEGAPAASNILEANGEVTKVVFDSKQETYSVKQEFELTLTNNGTTDIYGIYVDAIRGAVEDPSPDGNQHFEIIKYPASDLAPGASTTFVISYVLGLEKGFYEDDIYVGTANNDAAKKFVATFKVVDGTLYKLTVQTFPEDGSMGTGGAVMGVINGTYYNAPVGGSLTEGEDVWISVKPLDGYAIKTDKDGNYKVYYTDENGNEKYLTLSTAKTDDGEYLFQLPEKMPARDVTVYVEFYEPIPSKLRLNDLSAYANEVYPITEADLIQPSNEQTMYDVYIDPTYGTTGFHMDHFAYEVVIPADAESSGLSMTLYDIVVPYEVIGTASKPQTLNKVIKPTVTVKLDDGGETVIVSQTGTVGNAAVSVTPTVIDRAFNSPAPGGRKTATITVHYFDKETDTNYEQVYTVTFIRQTELPVHTFAYGNTPYGMIMNASNITDKTAAKEAFDAKNRYATLPNKALPEHANIVYWTQAWEKEYPNWPSNWGERNLDRNDVALVAYVGDEFDDPGVLELKYANGKKATGIDLKRSVVVSVLDENAVAGQYAAGTTASKFNGTLTEEIELSTLSLDSNGVGQLTRQNELQNWEQANGKTIRPGLYALKYEFVDFDGVTRSFTRPLVILRHLGDVDANGEVTKFDYSNAGDPAADAANEASDTNALLRRFAEPWRLADDTEVQNYPDYDKAIYRFRICDVNDDSHINTIDVNRIQNEATLTDWYCPTDYVG